MIILFLLFEKEKKKIFYINTIYQQKMSFSTRNLSKPTANLLNILIR